MFGIILSERDEAGFVQTKWVDRDPIDTLDEAEDVAAELNNLLYEEDRHPQGRHYYAERLPVLVDTTSVNLFDAVHGTVSL